MTERKRLGVSDSFYPECLNVGRLCKDFPSKRNHPNKLNTFEQRSFQVRAFVLSWWVWWTSVDQRRRRSGRVFWRAT